MKKLKEENKRNQKNLFGKMKPQGRGQACQGSQGQIEREAQDLLQQAEAHYRNELNRKLGEIDNHGKRGGIFSAIGRLLDTPIIDTTKKKDLE